MSPTEPYYTRIETIRSRAKALIDYVKANPGVAEELREQAAEAFAEALQPGASDDSPLSKKFWERLASAGKGLADMSAASDGSAALDENDADGNTNCKTMTTEFLMEIALLAGNAFNADNADAPGWTGAARRSARSKKAGGAKKAVTSKKAGGAKKALASKKATAKKAAAKKTGGAGKAGGAKKAAAAKKATAKKAASKKAAKSRKGR